MKGPGMRLDLDVRRYWRCPACGTKRHTPGQVTFVRCHFCKDHPAMSLVEQPRPLREPPPPLDLIIEVHPDDVDAPAFVPPHLREPEPAPPAETITEILTEPPAIEQAPESGVAAEAAAVVDAPDQPLTETSGEETGSDQASKPRKKKRRSRRQRRRNRSSKSDGDSGPTQQAGTGSAAGSDDSFGAGVDP